MWPAENGDIMVNYGGKVPIDFASVVFLHQTVADWSLTTCTIRAGEA